MRWLAVLCDVDGVLRHWDWAPVDDLEREFGAPVGASRAAAFAPGRLLPAITGRVTDEQWRAAIASELAAACGSAARAAELVERWSRDVGRIDDEVLELLVGAQRTVPVVLVTNATTRLERDLARLGVAGAIHRVANSCRIGGAKPEPAIYRAAADLAGVPAERCLFVDDTPGHVRAAEALGMTGLVYRDATDLRRALA
ncbi:MAG TPA: HAD-IA family hydrolase [Candidatus Dormibacteraeota bacterium]|nr:HAD-IA family hydrolase [Candidatus Dormibacteraeota bacterium]